MTHLAMIKNMGLDEIREEAQYWIDNGDLGPRTAAILKRMEHFVSTNEGDYQNAIDEMTTTIQELKDNIKELQAEVKRSAQARIGMGKISSIISDYDREAIDTAPEPDPPRPSMHPSDDQ